MGLNETFGALLRHYRELRGLSQEELALKSELDRTYIGQLERGLKSPTLTTLEKLAATLEVRPGVLLEELAAKETAKLTVAADYFVRDVKSITLKRADQLIEISAMVLTDALDLAHGLIDQLYDVEMDIASMLGPRNLSAFIGELFAAAVNTVGAGLFRKNPHQDGYPDLLYMDDAGLVAWNALKGRRNEKSPFSPFATGGIEVKATCGSVPTPKICVKRGFDRPDLGDSRIGCMTGYDWKAHHRETNNLAGIIWDFIDRRPRIAALMYSSNLGTVDWGDIVHPKAGGGRTTSVSIMSQSGIRKMYGGWLCVLKHGKYAEFLNRRNGGNLIRES